MRIVRPSLALLALVAVPAGCARTAGSPAATYAAVAITGVPHVEQEPDFCGEACAEMYLRKRGHPVSQDRVFDLAGIDPALGRGAHTPELARALARLGFDVGPTWFRLDGSATIDDQFAALHRDLVAGIPSIVCMHYDDAPDTTEHFRLILGYDPRTDEILYDEPAARHGADRRMKRAMFYQLWPLDADERSRMVIRMRLAARTITPPAPVAVIDDAALAQHVMKLRARVPASFTIRVERPFVIVGDEPAAEVDARIDGTIRWTTRMLEQDFFARAPTEILDVWLLGDGASYDTWARAITGEAPDTPYGFYSPDERALVMNISTGGGTLVHELVHPYVAANLPGCPAWFNEGLGSLYEQSAERDGHIVGLTNWRLQGLQDAIRAHALPSFSSLLHMSDHDFYHQDRGDNYAQARYLCYWLQEHGLLVRFYRELVSRRETDPSGYATLMRVIGEGDMGRFQKQWEAYVLALRFER